MSKQLLNTALEHIAAMRFQEDNGYQIADWQQIRESDDLILLEEAVDTICRSKMVVWCFKIAEYCKLQPDTVEITVSLVDRYLCTPEGLAARNDRWVYKLLCMSALYTTIKIHEPQVLSPDFLVTLSKGSFVKEDIESMERKILKALKWRVNPPTSASFVRSLLDLLVEQGFCKRPIANIALELSMLQLGMAAASNYQFATIRKSALAYAALMNALECLDLEQLGYVGLELAQPVQLDCNDPSIIEIQRVLYEAVDSQTATTRMINISIDSSPHVVRHKSSRRGSVDISPRGVDETP